MFRGSVNSTGYPLHSPLSLSLTLPCVTVCHHISAGVYRLLNAKALVRSHGSSYNVYSVQWYWFRFLSVFFGFPLSAINQSKPCIHSFNIRGWKISPLHATVPHRHAVKQLHELKKKVLYCSLSAGLGIYSYLNLMNFSFLFLPSSPVRNIKQRWAPIFKGFGAIDNCSNTS